MNKFYVSIGAVVLVALLGVGVVYSSTKNATPAERRVDTKVYVALEGDGAVAVVDATTNQVLKKIDLSVTRGMKTVAYMAHNVQVASDGSSVAVTANVEDKSMDQAMQGGTKDMDMSNAEADEIIIINPKNDSIVRRIPIEPESHLAHIVFEKDNRTALVTLQAKGMVYRVDTNSGRVLRKTALAADSGPHGLRLTPDGTKAYIALLSGKGAAILSTASGEAEVVKFPGAAVQTAVTPDGAFAFASLYDTKQVAWFDQKSGGRGLIDLPKGAKGPVQLYPTPDSRYLYVADQGYYFNQPTGSTIYRIDLASKSVDATIAGGSAPHGVVVSKDGTRLYVTNLVSNDMSVIDTATNTQVARIPIGAMPNGVSIWDAQTGGTP